MIILLFTTPIIPAARVSIDCPVGQKKLLTTFLALPTELSSLVADYARMSTNDYYFEIDQYVIIDYLRCYTVNDSTHRKHTIPVAVAVVNAIFRQNFDVNNLDGIYQFLFPSFYYSKEMLSVIEDGSSYVCGKLIPRPAAEN